MDEDIAKPSRLVEAGRLALLTLCLVFLAAWAMVWFQAEDAAVWQRDWYCLWAAGDGFLSGQWDQLYTSDFLASPSDGVCPDGYFWLYPPFGLYLAAIPALFPASWAYGLCVATVCLCMGLSLWLLPSVMSDRSVPYASFVLAALASAPFNSVIVTGQNSAVLLLAIVGGVWALAHQRWVLAALCLSVLWLKPNWMVLVVVWLAWRRQWKVLAGLGGAGAVLCLISVPLGWDLWDGFLVSSRGYGEFVLSSYPVDKLITAHAFVRSLAGGSVVVTWLLWVLLEGLLLWACWMSWRAGRSLAAQAGLVVLVTVAANVYTNFYDALVLLLPAAVWWLEQERYVRRWWWVIGASIAAGWVWMWVSIYLLSDVQGLPSVVGLFLVIWAVGEGLQSMSLRASQARPGK